MNQRLQEWRQAGKHLPSFLKDFHDQKDLFKAMHEMIGEPSPHDVIRRPSSVEGHCYVIDCFLWFMARHGYTLQRSRANQEFDSLDATLEAMAASRAAMLDHIFSGKTQTAETDGAAQS